MKYINLNPGDVIGRCEKISPFILEGNDGGKDYKVECGDDGNLKIVPQSHQGFSRGNKKDLGWPSMMFSHRLLPIHTFTDYQSINLKYF